MKPQDLESLRAQMRFGKEEQQVGAALGPLIELWKEVRNLSAQSTIRRMPEGVVIAGYFGEVEAVLAALEALEPK